MSHLLFLEILRKISYEHLYSPFWIFCPVLPSYCVVHSSRSLVRKCLTLSRPLEPPGPSAVLPLTSFLQQSCFIHIEGKRAAPHTAWPFVKWVLVWLVLPCP